jgi:hypothetical protein
MLALDMNNLQLHLQEIYRLTSERLIYAEGKNGALLAVTSLVFFRMMDTNLIVLPSLKLVYFTSLLFFAFSIVITVYSFIPILNIPRMMKKKKPTLPEDYNSFNNLLSSLRIAHYGYKDYTNNLLAKLEDPEIRVAEVDLDYSEHIIVNSKVVLFKFKCFHSAMVCMLIGTITAIIVKLAGLA